MGRSNTEQYEDIYPHAMSRQASEPVRVGRQAAGGAAFLAVVVAGAPGYIPTMRMRGFSRSMAASRPL